MSDLASLIARLQAVSDIPSPIADRTHVRCLAIEVLKHTPKGVWLYDATQNRRFVLRAARKRWAAPTRREALESFIARKGRQIRILNAAVDRAHRAREIAEAALRGL